VHNLRYQKIKIGKSYIEAVCIRLQSKNFILLRGRRGYVMCGYLDLKAAEKFGDAAVKIRGVSTIKQAIKTTVHSCTSQALKLGISKGQPVAGFLNLIV